MSYRGVWRPIVFLLASLSFACLLGQFAGLWTMHWFGCWVLPPATAALVAIAFLDRESGAGGRLYVGPRTWIVEGAIGGVVAAVVYDLYRLPFVLAGKPLYKVFPQFGLLLAGLPKTEPPQLVHQVLGWGYHFSNGAALGIMLLAMVTKPSRLVLLVGAVAWAMAVEMMLLATPYPTFFGLPYDGQFILLTASAHAIFGLALGAWLSWRLSRLQAPNSPEVAG